MSVCVKDDPLGKYIKNFVTHWNLLLVLYGPYTLHKNYQKIWVDSFRFLPQCLSIVVIVLDIIMINKNATLNKLQDMMEYQIVKISLKLTFND